MITKVGVRAHDYGKAAPDALFAAIAADGWQSVQLAFPKAVAGVSGFFDVTAALEQQVKAALSQSGLELGVLGAYVELGLTDEDARCAEVEKCLSQLATAARLGAGCVASETTARSKQPHATQAEAMDALRRSLSAVLPRAQALGVTVAVEPVFYHTLASAELASQLVRELACTNLKIVLDPVNLLAPERLQQQRLLWERTVELLGEDIAAVHVKGVRLENGVMTGCPLLQSQADMPFVLGLLKQLPQPLTIFREQAVPARAAEDLTYMRSMLG